MMTSQQIAISIIVLTYNRSRMLEDCLRAIHGQNYPKEKLEVIIVDDGSVDDTPKICREFMEGGREHWKYVHQIHRGIPATRNTGIRNSTGSIIAIVADDYVLPSNYVDYIEHFFKVNLKASIIRFKIFPYENQFFSKLAHLYWEVSFKNRLQNENKVHRSMLKRIMCAWSKVPELNSVSTEHNLEPAGAAAFRREVFEEVGLFDESLQRGEDTEMGERLRKVGMQIHYDPFLKIKHQYGNDFFKMLKKQFYTGVNRYKYLKKSGKSLSYSLNYVLQDLFLQPVRKAINASSLYESVAFLPFLFLLEFVTTMGALYAIVQNANISGIEVKVR
nr:Glycosyl transferase 2 [uncultured bacterium]